MTITAYIVIILMILLTCFCVVVSGICGFITYKALKKNFEFQDLVSDYSRFFEILSETVAEDTDFLRSELAKRLSAESIPEYRDLSRGLLNFSNKVTAIKEAADQLLTTADKQKANE